MASLAGSAKVRWISMKFANSTPVSKHRLASAVASDMTRSAILIALCLVATSHGFSFPSAESYVARLFRSASSLFGDQKSVSGFRCPRDEGLFQNPRDCSSFFQCSEGRVWLRQCPADLHFSAGSQRCEFPCDALCDRSLAEECGWDKQVPDEAICQMAPDKGPCNRNLKRYFYDDQSGSCKKFQYGGCKGNRNNFHTKEDCERACKNDHAPQQNNPLLSLSFPCLQNYENYTNPNDCGSYFTCSNGVAEVVQCPRGQHYSLLENKCTRPCEAVCDKSLACPCNWPSCVSQDFDSIHPALDNSLNICKDDGFYPIPGDCVRYTQCSDGVAKVLYCPVGQHFSPESRNCVDRCDAHCDESLAVECGWEYIETTKNSDATSGYEVIPDVGLPITCDRPGLYPHPSDCSRFIQCSNGIPYTMNCPRGLHFSEGLSRCVAPCDAHCDKNIACKCGWPECSDQEVDCDANPVRGPCKANIPRYYYNRDTGKCSRFYYGGCGGNSNNFQSKEECKEKCQQKLLGSYKCPIPNGKFANFYDCVSYYQCKDEVPVMKRCPRGTAFDHKKSQCVPEFEAVCLYKCRDRDAVYPYHPDCRKYIDCVNGISKVERCPLGKAFDWSISDCVEDEAVNCYSA